MKRSTHFVVASLFPAFLCQGQTLNHAYHYDSDRASNIVSIGAKSYFVERSFSFPNCCSEDVSLVCIAPNGNIIFKSLIYSWPWPVQPTIAVSPDKNLLISAGSPLSQCDTGLDEYRLWKVDTTGTLLWEHTPNSIIEQVAILSDATVYSFGQNVWTHLDASGAVIDQVTWPVPGIQSLAAFGQGEMVISYISNNIARIKKVNDTLKTLSDQPIQNAITQVCRSSDGSLLGIYYGQIQKYSATFNYMPVSLSALGSGNSAISYIERNDTVFVTGITPQKQTFYAMLDGNLQTLHMSISNVELAEPNGITLTDQNNIRITTSGKVSNDPGTHNFVGLMQTSLTGTVGSRQDIGPIGATLKHYSIETLTGYPGILQHNPTVEMDVKVVNYGNDTVRTFRLNHYAFVSGTSFCLFGLNNKIEKKIAPGDTETVNTGTFHLKPFYTSTSAVESSSLNICIFSTVPDSSNDNNIANDTYCLTTTLSLVGISEYASEQEFILLHPNPSSKMITLTSARILNTAELFESTGKKIGCYKINDRSFEMRHNLDPGIYYIKVYTEGKVNTKKILVTE